MKNLFLLFFLTLLISTNLHSFENPYIQQSRELNLSESDQWLKFLHYEKDFGIRSSEADGTDFFISPEGKKNPKKELESLIVALIETTTHDEQSALCRFPARSRWLKEILRMDEEFFPFEKCRGYSEFFSEHKDSTIYMVFSSYYLESPASAFGHTMIRLGKHELTTENNVVKSSNKESELLDTGIGYAAQTTTENAFLYAALGIVGGFKGTYSSIPYFYKIREYNDYESRDLWSYELNLSPAEKLKFLEHLWELGHTYFDYFYFTQNCSYNLITLLDTVNPSWKLADKIPFYIIPVDTLKAINRVPGLVKNVTFRPSIKKIFERSFSLLREDEKKDLLEAANNKNLDYISVLAKERRAIWADALIDFIDYKYARDILLERGEYFEWKKDLLAKRSQLGISNSPEISAIPLNERPDLGHESSRIEMGGGITEGRNYHGKLRFRFAMHDLLDPSIGQPSLASLNFFELGTTFNFQNKRSDKTNQFQFDYLKIFEVATLNPWTEFHKPLSLLAETGMKRHEACGIFNSTFECMTPYLEGGLGLTKANSLGSLSLFLQGEFNYSGRYKKNMAVFLGPKFIGIVRPNQEFAFGLKGQWLKEVMANGESYLLGSELRYYFSQDFGLKQNSEYLRESIYKKSDDHWKHDICLLYYF